MIRQWSPPPPLGYFVDRLWYAELDPTPHGRERLLPTGTTELVASLTAERIKLYSQAHPTVATELPAAVVCGPHPEFFLIDADQKETVIGVHFRPGGTRPFLGPSAEQLHNTHLSLESLWGRRADLLRERLLEAGSPEDKLRTLGQAHSATIRQISPNLNTDRDMPVHHLPQGFHSVTPFLSMQNLQRAIAFLKQAFDAEVTEQTTRPDGSLGHCEMRIGDSMLMLSQARGEYQPTRSAFYLYLPDVNATYRKALAAGATSLMEPTDTFYGNRESGVQDAEGNSWWIATRFEEVSREEIERRSRLQAQS